MRDARLPSYLKLKEARRGGGFSRRHQTCLRCCQWSAEGRAKQWPIPPRLSREDLRHSAPKHLAPGLDTVLDQQLRTIDECASAQLPIIDPLPSGRPKSTPSWASQYS